MAGGIIDEKGKLMKVRLVAVPGTIKELRKALPGWNIYHDTWSKDRKLLLYHKIECDLWWFDIAYGQVSKSDRLRALAAAYAAALAFEGRNA